MIFFFLNRTRQVQVTSCNLPCTDFGFSVRFTFKAFALLYRSVLFMHPQWDQDISLSHHSILTVYAYTAQGWTQEIINNCMTSVSQASLCPLSRKYFPVLSLHNTLWPESWSSVYRALLHTSCNCMKGHREKSNRELLQLPGITALPIGELRLPSLRVWGACELP